MFLSVLFVATITTAEPPLSPIQAILGLGLRGTCCGLECINSNPVPLSEDTLLSLTEADNQLRKRARVNGHSHHIQSKPCVIARKKSDAGIPRELLPLLDINGCRRRLTCKTSSRIAFLRFKSGLTVSPHSDIHITPSASSDLPPLPAHRHLRLFNVMKRGLSVKTSIDTIAPGHRVSGKASAAYGNWGSGCAPS